jgi:hypothetical protein
MQLCTALQDSIFTLPDNDITQKTLQAAIACAKSLVLQGVFVPGLVPYAKQSQPDSPL